MARQIIILDRVGYPSDEAYRIAFWLAVPVARRPFYAKPGFVSAVKGDAVPDVTEQAALEEGAVHERVEVVYLPAGTTLVQLRTKLISHHTALQAEIDAKNLWARHGTFYDGTAWTAKGVA